MEAAKEKRQIDVYGYTIFDGEDVEEVGVEKEDVKAETKEKRQIDVYGYTIFDGEDIEEVDDGKASTDNM
jgi:hypothetical protein